MRRFLPVVFALSTFFCQAQPGNSEVPWAQIDSLVRHKTELQVAEGLLRQWLPTLQQDRSYFFLARCYQYSILIADLRTEDSLYFKNSAIIDSLLKDGDADPRFRFALHLMQAKRLQSFINKTKSFNRKRYEQTGLPVNYAAYSNDGLDSIARFHFDQSKALADSLGGDIGPAIWLSTDPLLFLFRPDFFDVAIGEQINAVESYSNPQLDHSLRKLMMLSPDEFITRLPGIEHNDGQRGSRFGLYAQWLHHVQKGRPDAYYAVETMARKSFFKRWNDKDDSWISKSYDHYLLDLLLSPYAGVRAHAVYQLCMVWNKRSEEYFTSPFDNDYQQYSYMSKPGFDSSRQGYAGKTIQLLDRYRNLLDSFSFLHNLLTKIEQRIRRQYSNIRLEESNLPGRPLLAELVFRNADSLYYRILHIDNNNREPIFSASYIGELLHLPAIRERSVRLPVADDYNEHAAYLAIDALSLGSYVLLFSNKPFSGEAAGVSALRFRVTSIGVLENNGRVFVLDRKTGYPLAGASISTTDLGTVAAWHAAPSRTYRVNADGYAEMKDDREHMIAVGYQQDSIRTYIDATRNEGRDREAYDKDEYDDLEEYYEEEAEAYIYTDRSIYRPGQVVYFKAIFLTRNRRTGERMLLTRKNMRPSLLRNIYRKFLKEAEPMLQLENPFSKTIDSVRVDVNEFGSMSGRFQLPKSAATGDWSISPDYIDAEGGEFSVEEYKKPSYEITIEKPRQQLLPGDPFSFRIKVRSFAGAPFNQVSIKYRVERSGQLPVFDSLEGRQIGSSREVVLADTSSLTNDNGEMTVIVNDKALRGVRWKDDALQQYDYDLVVEAIDGSGEHSEEEASVKVSSMPVRLTVSAREQYQRGEQNSLSVKATHLNAGVVKKPVQLKIFRLETSAKTFASRNLMAVDRELYGKKELEAMFPDYNFNAGKQPARYLLLDTLLEAGSNQSIKLDDSRFLVGEYRVEIQCEESGRILGKESRSFSILDTRPGQQASNPGDIHYWNADMLQQKGIITCYDGNSEKPTYGIYHIQYYSKRGQKMDQYKTVSQDAGTNRWVWKLPPAVNGTVLLTYIWMMDNEINMKEERFFVDRNDKAPEIIVEQYRGKLAPGGKETFSLSVRTGNTRLAAEIMTTLYDASLDKLAEHNWEKPRQEGPDYLSNQWDIGDPYYTTSLEASTATTAVTGTRSAWWLDELGKEKGYLLGDWNISGSGQPGGSGSYDLREQLQGRIAGLSIMDTRGLDEVVVTAYGMSKTLNATSAAIIVRGSSSLNSYVQPLIILDGLVYTGDMGKLDPSSIAQGIVLKGADAVTLYGSAAANGVLVLNTHGEIIFPSPAPVPPQPVRKHFNETAFFFPALHAGKDGSYRFTFTMPEDLTEWNWKMLAHTRNASFVYAERKLTTQLPFMIQPHLPRLLYQGDQVVVKNRISNLDSSSAPGTAFCRIEDVVTGNDVTARWMKASQQEFLVEKKSVTTVSFRIAVPADQVNPVKIILSARSGSFSDGEENVLPVLSAKNFISRSRSVILNRDTVISVPQLPPDAEPYGMALSVNPKPQTALVNSLPYLANYSFECAEQLTNKLFANLMAVKIRRMDSFARMAFERAKSYVDKSSNAGLLPYEPSGESSPWLGLLQLENSQQENLFNLLDTSRTKAVVDGLLEKLMRLQNGDGGLTWFPGGETNNYISRYVLGRFGRMKDSGFLPYRPFQESGFISFLNKLVSYCDHAFTADTSSGLFRIKLQYVCERSYWSKEYPLTPGQQAEWVRLLETVWKDDPADLSLASQALLVLATLRGSDGGKAFHDRATALLASIRQRAIEDPVNGVRWKAISDRDDMSSSDEETLALIADAFDEDGRYPEVSAGIVKWLLTARTEHHWSTTKGTAAAIDRISREPSTVMGTSVEIIAKTERSTLSVTNDLLSGSRVAFAPAPSFPHTVVLHQAGRVPAQASFTWYYFSAMSDSGNAGSGVRIGKELQLQSGTGEWETLKEGSVLRVGDKVKVRITVESSATLSYIFIDDKRAAAFEPEDNSSGREYGSGFSWYRSVRDAGTQFFSDRIPAGVHILEYEVRVAQVGEFTSGPVSLQCMYRPDMSASSRAMKIVTLP